MRYAYSAAELDTAWVNLIGSKLKHEKRRLLRINSRQEPKSDQAMGGVKIIECLFLEKDF
jgi:hypothetical protein